MMRQRTASRIVGLAASVVLGAAGLLAKDALSQRPVPQAGPAIIQEAQQITEPALPEPHIPDAQAASSEYIAPRPIVKEGLPDRCVAAGAYSDPALTAEVIESYLDSGFDPVVLASDDGIDRICITVNDHEEEIRTVRTLILKYDVIDAYIKRRMDDGGYAQVSIDDLLVEAVERAGLSQEDETWTKAVLQDIVRVESNFKSNYNPFATSTKGARGVTQVMPMTARLFDIKRAKEGSAFGVHTKEEYERMLHNAVANVDLGPLVLIDCLERYGDDRELVVACYNAGPTLLERVGRDYTRIAETRDYVKKVLG